jgi:hypothetical protein
VKFSLKPRFLPIVSNAALCAIHRHISETQIAATMSKGSSEGTRVRRNCVHRAILSARLLMAASGGAQREEDRPSVHRMDARRMHSANQWRRMINAERAYTRRIGVAAIDTLNVDKQQASAGGDWSPRLIKVARARLSRACNLARR